MTPIKRLDCVTIRVPDAEDHGRAWAGLLGVAPLRERDERRFQFWNAALELRAQESVLRGAPPCARLERLAFAATAPAHLSANGVPIELSAEDARVPRSRPSTPDVAPESSVVALDHVVIRCPDLDASLAIYRDRLGLRLALDRTFPERRVRLVFFRVGGVTVELSGSTSPGKAGPGGTDTLWGLAWRVLSIEAAHRRLLTADFAASAPRDGHKAGTRVFHLDDPPSAVPTLVLEDPARRKTDLDPPAA